MDAKSDGSQEEQEGRVAELPVDAMLRAIDLLRASCARLGLELSERMLHLARDTLRAEGEVRAEGRAPPRHPAAGLH